MKTSRFLLIACVAFIAGCARVTTSTTLHADGSFTRKVVYTATKMNMAGGSTTDKAGQAKEKPEDFFRIPSSPDVKIVRADNQSGITVTATREVAAGSAPLEDIALWAQKGKVMATSSVTVKKLGDGSIEYVETLHSTQPGKSAQKFLMADLRARVKKSLPEADQKTELIDNLTIAVTMNLAHALLGPPEANLFSFLVDPEAAARRVNIAAFNANVKTLKNEIPSLTDDQAIAISRSLANALNQEMLASGDTSSQEADKDQSADNAITPLNFAVAFPGKVVETNGNYDPSTGEVFWSLLPMTLDIGDVKLRLVVQP